MKTFKINIHPKLKDVSFTVKNGKKFTENIVTGSFCQFSINIDPKDIERVKKFAIEHGDDKSSNNGSWYAHCNKYAMDLFINYNGSATINTYRPFCKYDNK